MATQHVFACASTARDSLIEGVTVRLEKDPLHFVLSMSKAVSYCLIPETQIAAECHSTQALLDDPGAITPAIDKPVAFAEAGADFLYAPGVQKKGDIAAMERAVAPKPVNILVMGPGFNVAELADSGVRRISVGDALSQVSWAAVLSAAENMKAGFFDGLALAISGRAYFFGISREEPRTIIWYR